MKTNEELLEFLTFTHHLNAMRIFITGILGQLGYNLASIWHLSGHQISGSYHKLHKHPAYLFNKLYHLNLSSDYHLISQLQALPDDLDLFVHCAAFTDVNQSENLIEKTYQINSVATQILSRWARHRNIPFIYISTDFVFEGISDGHHEETLPNPKGHYARSKYFGELASLNEQNTRVIRWTPLIHCFQLAHHPMSFPNWLITSTRQNQRLGLFKDKTLSPVSSLRIAEAIIQSEKSKILHVCSQHSHTVFGLSSLLLDFHDLPNLHIPTQFPSEQNYGQIRPKHSGMTSYHLKQKTILEDWKNCQKFTKSLGFENFRKFGVNPLFH